MLLPASAAIHVSTVNFNDKEITAICSGDGKVRWIKLSNYYQTGKLTFIEPPSKTEQTNKINNTCSLCSLFNHFDHSYISLDFNNLIIEGNVFETPISFIPHFTKRTTLTASSRDPPLFFK